MLQHKAYSPCVLWALAQACCLCMRPFCCHVLAISAARQLASHRNSGQACSKRHFTDTGQHGVATLHRICGDVQHWPVPPSCFCSLRHRLVIWRWLPHCVAFDCTLFLGTCPSLTNATNCPSAQHAALPRRFLVTSWHCADCCSAVAGILCSHTPPACLLPPVFFASPICCQA